MIFKVVWLKPTAHSPHSNWKKGSQNIYAEWDAVGYLLVYFIVWKTQWLQTLKWFHDSVNTSASVWKRHCVTMMWLHDVTWAQTSIFLMEVTLRTGGDPVKRHKATFSKLKALDEICLQVLKPVVWPQIFLTALGILREADWKLHDRMRLMSKRG